MKFYTDSNSIHFKCDHGFFVAVEVGVKTAEVRMLSRSEWQEVEAYQPKTMYLTSLHTNQTIMRRIGYMAEVGEIVGNHLILFCFARAEEGGRVMRRGTGTDATDTCAYPPLTQETANLVVEAQTKRIVAMEAELHNAATTLGRALASKMTQQDRAEQAEAEVAAMKERRCETCKERDHSVSPHGEPEVYCGIRSEWWYSDEYCSRWEAQT